MIKQVLQANLVVHDGLQALDALQLHSVPLRVTETRMFLILFSSLQIFLLPETFIEDIKDLLESLVTKVLDPLQAVVGQCNPQRLNAAVLLGQG